MLIDFHTHVFPERIASRAVEKLAFEGGSLVPQTDGTLASLKAQMAADGVDISVVLSIATNPTQQANVNRFAVEMNRDPAIVAFGSVHPDALDVLEELENIKAAGLKGVKLHPDIQRVAIDDERMHKIYECVRGRLPILMHTGDHRFDFSNPNRMLPILQKYSDLTVIGAHFGGWSVWDAAEKSLCGFDNFFVDCSSSLYAMTAERAKELIDAYGVNRVLFGTDYPMWDIDTEIERFMRIDLTEEEREKILSSNAASLFSIGGF